MTRPLGKSPARFKPVRPQLDANPLSFVDVRAEDDSLLPGNGDASQQKNLGPVTSLRPGASPFKASGVKSLACIQEDLPECEDVQGNNGDEARDMLTPLATEEPAIKKKKKKTGFNLRKSLAWNNAFFTEEGVLDPDELSLVNRTFKKPPEEPKPFSNKKSPLTTKLMNPSTISKHFSPVRLQKPSVQVENRHHAAAPGNSVKSTGNASKRADLHNYGVKDFAASKQGAGAFPRVQADLNKHDKLMVPNRTEYQGLKPLPLKKLTEEKLRAVAGGPALPPVHSGPKPPLDRTKQTQGLASTLSAASKKMKDRLGMVFSGRTVYSAKVGIKSTAEDDAVVPSSTLPYNADSAKLTRCYSHSSYERFGKSAIAPSSEPAISKVSNINVESRAPNLQGALVDRGPPSLASTAFSSSLEPRFLPLHVKEQNSASFFSHTQGVSSFPKPPHAAALPDTSPISKETAGSDVVPSGAKPSGLRMPSPKLGFFDKPSRNNGAPRLPIDVNGMCNTGKQSIGYGAIPQSIRNTGRQTTESATVNNYTKQPSLLKPPLPLPIVNSGQVHSQAMGQSNTTNVLSGIPTVSHLRPIESSSKPVTSTIQGSSSVSSRPCATSSVAPSTLNVLTLPGSSILPARPALVIDGPPSNSSCSAGAQVSETGSEVRDTSSQVGDTGVVLQVKKNAQNILPAVKREVNQLSLSPLRIVKGQENLLLAQPKDKGSSHNSPSRRKACSNEDANSPSRRKACSNEDANGALASEAQEEWPQVKSGAVQHSPPNKEPPKYGPWSPVRRNAPELGPFDCTKYTNTGILH